MADLHSALQNLGPVDFSSIPTEVPQAQEYLQHLFAQAQIIIDSVPPPIEVPSTPARPRSNTATSNVSSASDLSASSARSEPIDPANVSLQKEWSKPIKLGAKENPLGMSVYKLGGKDGRGAWFARRSVHEGLGFRKWKLGLQREFPESTEVQGGPGEGNIRGIGGERRVEQVTVDGLGTIEVYHLSAQFPGPTTPRDFVTLLVTSSTALEISASSSTPGPGHERNPSYTSKAPRHFMVLSKPCMHPDCPPRDGYVRGNYESIEFIREIPVKPKKSSSTTDLPHLAWRTDNTPSVEKAALVRSAQQVLEKGSSGDEMLADMNADGHVPLAKDVLVQEGRKRGKTISFAESRGVRAKGEAVDTPHDAFDDPAEQNPVEWIMITRSDPGGNVPRFMVERGTPAGIVSDASKFLDWACKKEHPVKDDYGEQADQVDQDIDRKGGHRESLEQYQTNGHLAGLEEETPASAESSMTLTEGIATSPSTVKGAQNQEEGAITTLATAMVAGLESYAPQVVLDRLPGHQQEVSSSSWLSNNPVPAASNGRTNASEAASIASTSDTASFASAEDHFDDDDDDASSKSPKSLNSTPKKSPAAGGDRQQRELSKLEQRKKALDDQLARTREKETKDRAELTSREEERIRKAEEKHARETAKYEERFQKEVAKLEAKRQKDEQKSIEKKKKAEDKDEKVRLLKERDAARSEAESLKKEAELLKEQIGALQKENTVLVSKIGKLEGGKKALGELQAELESDGRSRSPSLRTKRGEGSGATIAAAIPVEAEATALLKGENGA
ncbi:MAG: hypothetical protein Q9220_001979 [cf. Caloplaca sp. 1 TL-2023]